MEQTLQKTTLFEEHDEYSKKRVSLHKVAIHDREGQVTGYQYHMIIIDLAMTMDINLSEATVINLIKSMKQ